MKLKGILNTFKKYTPKIKTTFLLRFGVFIVDFEQELFRCLYFYHWIDFIHCSGVSTAEFEQGNAGWISTSGDDWNWLFLKGARGLGKCTACKWTACNRFAVQTLLWSLEFVIHQNLTEHDTFAALALFRQLRKSKRFLTENSHEK